MEDDEARQLKEVLKETGNRRKHRTDTAASSTSVSSASASSASSAASSPATSRSRTASHEGVYPDLTQPAASSASHSATRPAASASASVPPAASSTPFTGGWKPAAASTRFSGAPVAQPVSYPLLPLSQRSAPQSDDKEYVMVDDDSPHSAELARILRRQSLTASNTASAQSTTRPPIEPPPLGQRLSGDLRYAKQLQEEEEKLAKQEEEDRKQAEQLAQQEEEDHKYAMMLQQRDDFEAGHPIARGSDDDDDQSTGRSHPTSRPTSAATGSSWSASWGPFTINAGIGSQERMQSTEEMRRRLLRQMQLSGLMSRHSAFDTADAYDDDMHMLGRFRPLSSAFGSHSLSGFPSYGQPDVDNMSYEQLLELSERIGQVKHKGMAAEQLSVLPTWRWKGAAASVKSESRQDEKKSEGGGDGDASCSICLTPYDIGEEIKRLPCMHTFHAECIDRWLVQNEKCPICNTPVSQGVGGGEAGARSPNDGGGGVSGRGGADDPFDIIDD